MTDPYQGYEGLRPTPVEEEAHTAFMMAHMEKKFITDRTAAKLKKRLIKLGGNMATASTLINTDIQTLRRWCNNKNEQIPGIAWAVVDMWEKQGTLPQIKTDYSPEELKKEFISISGDMTQAAVDIGTEPQTLRRWCRGTCNPPGIAFVALALLKTYSKDQ